MVYFRFLPVGIGRSLYSWRVKFPGPRGGVGLVLDVSVSSNLGVGKYFQRGNYFLVPNYLVRLSETGAEIA